MDKVKHCGGELAENGEYFAFAAEALPRQTARDGANRTGHLLTEQNGNGATALPAPNALFQRVF